MNIMHNKNFIDGQVVLKIPIREQNFKQDEKTESQLKPQGKVRPKISIITYEVFFLLLNSLSSIVVYLLNSKSLTTLMFSLLPCMVVCTGILFYKLYLKLYTLSIPKVSILNLFLYYICMIVLVVTYMNIYNQYFDIKEFALIPDMYYLIGLVSQCPLEFKLYPRLLLVLNFAIGVFSLAMNLRGLQSIETTLLQFMMFASMLKWANIKIAKPYKIEDSNKFFQDSVDCTPIEIVMKMLSTVQEEFDGIILCENCEFKGRKCYNILENVTNTLRNSPNIYSSSIEIITKNMNQEDKIFIEQSFSDKSIYSSVNGNEDVKENINLVYGVNDLSGVLKQIGFEWNFNTFFVSDCSGSKPLRVCGEYILKKYNFDKVYKIPEDVLDCFLNKLEDGYLPNSYHNSCHAADMMSSFLYIINISNLIKKMSNVELMSCIIACLSHDLGHIGKSNRFLILSRDPLALRYNDISVQEMMHISNLYQILLDRDCNILANLNSDMWFSVRKIIVEMILATDMNKHFEILGVIKAKYLNTLQNIDTDQADFKIDVFKMGIKCADLGHAAKEIEFHNKWCSLLIQEFFQQGDTEKELGLPISMYCDRQDTDIPKSQAGFIQNVVLPIFIALNGLLRTNEIESNCIAQIKRNKNFWGTRRSLSKNQTVLIKKEENYNEKEYKKLMEKTSRLKRSSTPFVLSPNT